MALHIYMGVQKRKEINNKKEINDYVRDKNRIMDGSSFNPLNISDNSHERSGCSCSGICNGLKSLLKRSQKFYIFMGLVLLNICIFLDFFFYNLKLQLYSFLFIIIYNAILLEIIMLHLTKMLYKNLEDSQKQGLKKWFWILGLIITLMTIINTGLIMVVMIEVDIKMLGKSYIDILSVDRVQLYDNITILCNMIGIIFTLIVIIIFFRRIKSDFVLKQKQCLEELNYED